MTAANGEKRTLTTRSIVIASSETKETNTANNMAIGGTLCLILVAVFGFIFFRTFGHSFEVAANSGHIPSAIAIANTPYFFLISASTGSTIFAVIVFLGYIVFWPLIMYISMLQQTRMLFAYARQGRLRSCWPSSAARFKTIRL